MRSRGKYLNPLNDLAFKKLFGTESSSFILVSFLNAVLELPEGRRIKEVQILNPHVPTERMSAKGGEVDVRCVDEQGKQYIVEMQVYNRLGFKNRVIFYGSRAFSLQLQRGDNYVGLRPVIFIGVLNFQFFENPDYIVHHELRDRETGEHYFDNISFHFVQLPCFNKKEEELETLADKWAFFLRNAENLEEEPATLQDPEFEESFHLLWRMQLSDEEAEDYLDMDIAIQDEINKIGFAREEARKQALEEGIEQGIIQGREQGIEEGIEQGIIQGREQGIEEGIEQGIIQGIEEGIEQGKKEEKLRVIRKLLAKNFSLEEVAEATELTVEEIKNLIN